MAVAIQGDVMDTAAQVFRLDEEPVFLAVVQHARREHRG